MVPTPKPEVAMTTLPEEILNPSVWTPATCESSIQSTSPLAVRFIAANLAAAELACILSPVEAELLLKNIAISDAPATVDGS